MSNALKRTCVAVAGVLVSVSSPLSSHISDVAAATPPPNREKPKSLCCPPNCSPSQYAGPNCITSCHCKEINFRGEALYWVSSLGGLEAAFGTTKIATTVASGITTTTVTETDKAPDWKWRPGYRVGADFGFSCFVLEADWTHYKGHASFHKEGQNGSWNLKYDAIDLLFGRRCSVAPCFYFKPFLGVRGTRIHQTLKSNLETLFTSIIGNNTIPTVKNDKERFWGIGPELGVEADWHMGWNWSLYGSFDVVTYYGSIHTTTHNTDTFTTTISQSDGKISRPFRSIATDASFGLRWDKAWPVASEVLLTVKLGVEQHRIYDFSNLGSDGTLSMDGANLAASIGYRY